MTDIPTATTPTIADVRSAVEASTDLTSTERRDLVSALNRTCSFLQKPAEAIPVNVGALRRAFDGMAPVALGVEARTLSNIRSGLFRAIQLSGLARVRRNQRVVWVGDWAVIDAAVRAKGEKPYQLITLHRFGTWCGEQSISPADVDDAVLAAFSEALEREAIRQPNKHAREIARRWNKLRVELPELGLQALKEPDIVHKHRRVHLAALPASFYTDLEAYRAFLACEDPVADNARAKPLRPASIQSALQGLMTAADAAVTGGVDPADIVSLAVLTEPRVARATFKTLLARSQGQTTGGMERIRKMLMALARHLHRDDPARINALKVVLTKVPALRAGMTRKNSTFLRQVADGDVTRARLVQLPAKLFTLGMSAMQRGERGALENVQVALALEILLVHGLRRKNLTTLSWSRHITWPAGQKSPTLLHLPAQEMKSQQEMTRQIGPALARMLIAYREKVLPALVQGSPDVLFCKADGKALSEGALVNRIKQAVWDHVGIKMTLHQFRHLGATIILDQIPEAYELARDHLGHSSSTITQRYYSGQRTLQASRTYAEIIDRARASNTASKHAKRRPTGKPAAQPPSSSTKGTL